MFMCAENVLRVCALLLCQSLNDAIRLLKVKNTQRNSHTLIVIIMTMYVRWRTRSTLFRKCIRFFTVCERRNRKKTESFIIYDADFGLRLHNNKYPHTHTEPQSALPMPYHLCENGRVCRRMSTRTSERLSRAAGMPSKENEQERKKKRENGRRRFTPLWRWARVLFMCSDQSLRIRIMAAASTSPHCVDKRLQQKERKSLHFSASLTSSSFATHALLYI